MKKFSMVMMAGMMSLSLAACLKTEVKVETTPAETHWESAAETVAETTRETETESIPETEARQVELVGPWHLDEEKTDMHAIEEAWETFAGYGEWGASMEIRSDGQMSWYIGAVGGTGTYTTEGDVLHAELKDSLEQKDMPMDFTILENHELKMTYADLDIIWVYGE